MSANTGVGDAKVKHYFEGSMWLTKDIPNYELYTKYNTGQGGKAEVQDGTAGVPFGSKRSRDLTRQIRKAGEDTIGLPRLIQVQALFRLGDTISEYILAPAQIPELTQNSAATLQFHHGKEYRTVGLLNGLGHPVKRDGVGDYPHLTTEAHKPLRTYTNLRGPCSSKVENSWSNYAYSTCG